MARMRLRDRLDRRLATQRLRSRHVQAVAKALAVRHEQAEPCGDTDGAATPAALGRRVQELEARLEVPASRALPHAALSAILAEQRRFLVEAIEALLDRVAEQRIRAIHGGLGCHAVWVDRKQRVRFTEPSSDAGSDVVEDVAGLALDLRARRGARHAERLLGAYALAGDDYGLFRVLAFYERDAACRRALEASSNAGPDADAPEPRAFALAALAKPSRPAVVIATGGPVASGKSTVAKAMAKRFAAPRIVADRVRDTLLEPIPEGIVHELVWDRSFSEGFAERVYQGVLRRAEAVLASGRAVVLDACFPDAARRHAAAALAERHGAPFVFVHCDPPPRDIEERLAQRDRRDGLVAGGWQAIASELAARFEPPRADDRGHVLRVDTSLPQSEWMGALAPALEARCQSPLRGGKTRR